MMIKRSVLVAAALLTTGTTVGAEGWSVVNFASMAEQADCMARAEATVAQYRETYSAEGPTRLTEWTVAGFNLRGDVIDAIFLCPMEAGLAAPFLIVYNTDSDSAARQVISDRLQDIWAEVGSGGGAQATPEAPENGSDDGGNDGIVDFN